MEKTEKKEYYYLKKDEIIQEGDECGTTQKYNEDYVWKKETTCIGQKAPDPKYMAHRKYRRAK